MPQGSFAATVFDVGRGQAVLVRTARHALLFDDGESWGSGGAISAARLLPALRYYDVRRLDALLLPRIDADRGAGALALLAAVPPQALLAGGERALPPEFAACRAGTRWRWDGVDFELLDTRACTLRVSTGGSVLVLTGPCRRTARAASASRRSLSSRAAQLALLSATARAAQGASVAAAVRTWRAAGAQVFVTGIDGALELRCAATGSASLVSWRKP